MDPEYVTRKPPRPKAPCLDTGFLCNQSSQLAIAKDFRYNNNISNDSQSQNSPLTNGIKGLSFISPKRGRYLDFELTTSPNKIPKTGNVLILK